MITRDEATEIARRYLRGLERPGKPNLALVEEVTIERPFGWCFFWTSQRYLETDDDRWMLVVNAPFIVDRRDGSVHLTGTARPVEYYIERYERERSPDPHPGAPPCS